MLIFEQSQIESKITKIPLNKERYQSVFHYLYNIARHRNDLYRKVPTQQTKQKIK